MDVLALIVADVAGAMLIGVISAFLMSTKFDDLGSWVGRVNWWRTWWVVSTVLGGLFSTAALLARFYLERDVINGFDFPEPLEYLAVSSLLVASLLCIALEKVSNQPIPVSGAFDSLTGRSRTTYWGAALVFGAGLFSLTTQFGFDEGRPEGFNGYASIVVFYLGALPILGAIGAIYFGLWEVFETRIGKALENLRGNMAGDLARIGEAVLVERIQVRLADFDEVLGRKKFKEAMDIPKGRNRNLRLAHLYITLFRFSEAARAFREYTNQVISGAAGRSNLIAELEVLLTLTRTPRLKKMVRGEISKAKASLPASTAPSEEDPRRQPVRLQNYLVECEAGWELARPLRVSGPSGEVRLSPGLYRRGERLRELDIARLCDEDARILVRPA